MKTIKLHLSFELELELELSNNQQITIKKEPKITWTPPIDKRINKPIPFNRTKQGIVLSAIASNKVKSINDIKSLLSISAAYSRLIKHKLKKRGLINDYFHITQDGINKINSTLKCPF